MAKPKDLRIQGVGFEEGLRRMLATPAPKTPKRVAKKISKRRKRN